MPPPYISVAAFDPLTGPLTLPVVVAVGQTRQIVLQLTVEDKPSILAQYWRAAVTLNSDADAAALDNPQVVGVTPGPVFTPLGFVQTSGIAVTPPASTWEFEEYTIGSGPSFVMSVTGVTGGFYGLNVGYENLEDSIWDWALVEPEFFFVGDEPPPPPPPPPTEPCYAVARNSLPGEDLVAGFVGSPVDSIVMSESGDLTIWSTFHYVPPFLQPGYIVMEIVDPTAEVTGFRVRFSIEMTADSEWPFIDGAFYDIVWVPFSLTVEEGGDFAALTVESFVIHAAPPAAAPIMTVMTLDTLVEEGTGDEGVVAGPLVGAGNPMPLGLYDIEYVIGVASNSSRPVVDPHAIFECLALQDYPIVVTEYEWICDTTPPVRSITIPTCATDSELGVGSDLRVLLLARGGTTVLAELNPVSGNFTRDLDATSNLELTGVTTGVLGESCCEGWDQIYPWATEIIVYRDGRDAWCGPVTGVEFGYGMVKVTASDLTAWWDRRVLETDLTFTDQDLSDILVTLHNAAMASDPVDNFTLDASPSNVIGTRSYLANDYQYVSDLIDELSKTGVDWSAYGRHIFVGGEEVPSSPYVTLTDDFWTVPPTLAHRGNEQATKVVVKGKGVTGLASASPEYLAYYGELVRVFDESTIEDEPSATAAARTRVDILKDQIYIETPSGAGLKPTAPITLPELVPGIRVRVATSASCRQLTEDFRLKSVKVDFNGQVSISLQPIGTVGSL